VSNSTGYKTKQQDLILNCLINNKEVHITVESVLEYLKLEGSSVGQTTVYRYLDKLVNNGIVRKYNFENGERACFQYIDQGSECNQHFHLKCVTCCRLIHLKCEQMSQLQIHIFNEHGFNIDNCKTTLYGQCEDCVSKQK